MFLHTHYGKEMDDTAVEILPSHHASVGAFDVRRVLPQRGRRTLGPWCFADHMGPADVTEEHGLDIGPLQLSEL